MDQKAKDDGENDWESFVEGMQLSHSGECPYPCPLCTGIGLIRQMNPEIAAHLSAAGREFILAARAFMESLQTNPTPRHRDEVEKIPFE